MYELVFGEGRNEERYPVNRFAYEMFYAGRAQHERSLSGREWRVWETTHSIILASSNPDEVGQVRPEPEPVDWDDHPMFVPRRAHPPAPRFR